MATGGRTGGQKCGFCLAAQLHGWAQATTYPFQMHQRPGPEVLSPRRAMAWLERLLPAEALLLEASRALGTADTVNRAARLSHPDS